MQLIKNKLFFLVIFLVFTITLFGQDDREVLSSYVRKINMFSKECPQEKVWLHFDNTGYYIGESIWFKGYVVGAAHHDTTFFSRVLHVELLTADGHIIDSRKLKIVHGQCHGEFRLEKEYRSGFYEVRADTRHQLNFSEESLFSRVFPVYSFPKPAGNYTERKLDRSGVLSNQRQKLVPRERLNLSFYPEGGNAVLDLRSRIAFQATDQEGNPVDVKGIVYNTENDSVAAFTTQHQGIGFFDFTPASTEYKWQLMSGVQPFHPKYYVEEGLDISGRLVGYWKNADCSVGDFRYWMLQGEVYHGKCTTDMDGRFHFTLPDSVAFGKKCSLGLQYSVKGKRRDCRILLDRSAPSGRGYVSRDLLVLDSTTVFSEQVDRVKRSVMDMQYLDEVVIQSDRIKADIVLDVERDIASLMDRGEKYPMTVAEYLESRVMAMNESGGYKYGNEKTYLCYRYWREETLAKIKSEHGSISKWDIEDVDKIKNYYTHRSAWDFVTPQGCECRREAPIDPQVFVWSILHDDGLHDEHLKGIHYTYFEGYSRSKEYYHQDNRNKLPGEADFRRTLYWNPNVQTDEAGKVRLSFYNNSSSKRMSVDVAGVTEQGILIIGDK